MNSAKLGYYHILYPLVYTLFLLFKGLILSCRQLSCPVKIYYISILVQESKMDTLWHFKWERGLTVYFTLCVILWTSYKWQQEVIHLFLCAWIFWEALHCPCILFPIRKCHAPNPAFPLPLTVKYCRTFSVTTAITRRYLLFG